MSAPDPIQTFLQEAADLLTQIEEIALDLGQRPDDAEAVNRMFRAFHTLKGSGAMFGFDAVAGFTHHVETALDQVRAGTLTIDRPLLTLLLSARDQIEALLEDPDNVATAGECDRIVKALAALCGHGEKTASTAPAASQAAPADGQQTWRITFQPASNIAASGTNPLSLIDELRTLGPCRIEADVSRVPAIDALNPENCHLGWTVELTSDRGENAIRDVFIFVEDACTLKIEAMGSAAPAPAPVAAATPTAPSVAPSATGKAPADVPVASPAPASSGSPAAARKPATKEATVRVPSSKLDRLVGLVGELVMNQSRLMQVATSLDNAHLSAPVEAIERLVAELRDSVLGIRMMPIGSTFSRFKRLVHDLSQELGKEIDLVTEGAETELDKTVLDQLGDPLIHLIRNSIDHGIGTPEQRRQNGKPARGTIRLTALHAGSHVVISIQDDGRGLDSEAIRAKAVERGLIAADATLPEKDLFNLIFLPGFSTAKQITNVSGRGVGMDVVKKQIEALRGTINLTSRPGVGTTISLTLPLTLAIIEGLVVELGGDQFILPMSSVLENVELHQSARKGQNRRNVVVVRDELIPYIDLRELFAIGGDRLEIEKVVIVRHEDHRVGLVVDRVLGSHQTVIQSLGNLYKNIEVCSGSTIMGDGRVALILDLAGTVRRAEAQRDALVHEAA